MRAIPDVTRWATPARIDYDTTRKKGPFVDGDTFILERLVSPKPRLEEGEMWVRLLEVDTPELSGSTHTQGLAAAVYTRLWLERIERETSRWPFVVEALEKDSFGRWLSYVWRRSTGECLNEALISAGHSTRISAKEQILIAQGGIRA